MTSQTAHLADAPKPGHTEGLCWLCGEFCNAVTWIGSARTRYGDIDISACGTCLPRLEEMALKAHRYKDLADCSAR
jgi:hypothetical protein